MKLIIGAYAASPSAGGWNLQNESEYYAGIRKMAWVGGLEIPFLGTLHTHDPEWFLEQLSPQWNSVITPIPGVMNTLVQDPTFGLASVDDSGRQRAVDYVHSVLLAVQKMNRFFSKQVVSAVELHSAPTLGKPGVGSSVECFAQSLSEIRAWNWEGAHLSVEHCDRFTANQIPAKGFLSLEEELQGIALASGPTPIGILINWGRSAIEGRAASHVEAHIRLAKKAGALNGLIFSGATQDNPLYGNWADSHAPFETPGSVLTQQNARACVRLAEAEKLRVFGFKMQSLPKSLGVRERLEFLQKNAELCLSLLKAES
jgi:hypothetical protein